MLHVRILPSVIIDYRLYTVHAVLILPSVIIDYRLYTVLAVLILPSVIKDYRLYKVLAVRILPSPPPPLKKLGGRAKYFSFAPTQAESM